MRNQGFSEKDWKLFRSKVVGWQEAYMDKLERGYIKLLTGNGDPADKFWELEKRINKDKKDAGIIMEMKRSSLIFNIISLLNEGAIAMSDLDDFSDELKNVIKAYTGRDF